jgi:predicted ArsR family transcriptional regulator
MKTREQILFLLKTRGAQSTQWLAEALEMTLMGARGHLQGLQESGLLDFEERQEGKGRPTRYWQLTEAGHSRFPDRHSDLTVGIIHQVQTLFGQEGLQRLIDAREAQALHTYQARLATCTDLAGRVQALAALRHEEGYMAEVLPQPDGSWLLVENHCPICAAAKQCQQFCRSELQLFQTLLGPKASVVRAEHLLAGARRCAYQITPQITPQIAPQTSTAPKENPDVCQAA